MKKLSVSWTVKKIVQNINKDNILFNHPIQRKSGQWTDEQKSLLIHTLLSDYPVPPLYAIQDEKEGNKYSVLDGKQRLTVIQSFMNDEWTLLDDTPEVIINDITYEISGLKFSQLEEDIKEELQDASLLMYIFEDCTDEEIEEIFYRLNNGTALTKDQKTRAKLGNDLAQFVDEVLELDFFKKKACFTNCQLKRAEDQTCVLQTLMLMTGYKFKLFGNDDILKFVESYRYEYKQSDLESCKNLFIKINDAFKEKHKLIKKINIPMFIMALKTAEEMEISFDKFTEWINNFVNTYDTKSEYASYCSGNTTNKEKVNKRLELMYDSLLNYIV